MHKYIPWPMRSRYLANGAECKAFWIQWRNHIWFHRMKAVNDA